MNLEPSQTLTRKWENALRKSLGPSRDIFVHQIDDEVFNVYKIETTARSETVSRQMTHSWGSAAMMSCFKMVSGRFCNAGSASLLLSLLSTSSSMATGCGCVEGLGRFGAVRRRRIKDVVPQQTPIMPYEFLFELQIRV